MFVVTPPHSKPRSRDTTKTLSDPKFELNVNNPVSTLAYYGEKKPGEIPVFHCALDCQLSADGDRVDACNYPSRTRVPSDKTA
jgi:hypothetical protein